MEPERRRLVIEFFIPHFIAMARSSEKFDALRQAIIYLEQAQRLGYLLREEPGGDITAREYLDIIRDKLADCQRKIVSQGGYKMPLREKSFLEKKSPHANLIRKQRPRYEHIVNQNSPTDGTSIAPLTFVDVHVENLSNQNSKKYLEIHDSNSEESKL